MKQTFVHGKNARCSFARTQTRTDAFGELCASEIVRAALEQSYAVAVMAVEPEVLSFHWRTSNDHDAPHIHGATHFLANETVDALRRRLAKECGSSAADAGRTKPEVWLCNDDDDETPITRQGAPGILLWSPVSCPRLLFERYPSGRPKAFLLFTFPPATAPATGPSTATTTPAFGKRVKQPSTGHTHAPRTHTRARALHAHRTCCDTPGYRRDPPRAD